MSQPLQKVEIGFNLTDSPLAPDFILLDDPVAGVIGSLDYVIGGELFYDVTENVKSITIRRGKNRELDQYDQGLANVVFNNNDRTFDPEYALSPYAGQIVPKKKIRISSNGEISFFGLIDDWNLSYETNGDSIAEAACSDATSALASQTLGERTNSVQLSGSRITTILDLPEIAWPADERDIDPGQMSLGADTIPDNTNALSYLRIIEQSEPGSLFIGKSGLLVFKDRLTSGGSTGITLADDGTGIPYQLIRVQYGSELLANEIVLESAITTTQVITTDPGSIETYGIFNLTRTDLLINSDTDLENLAVFYANKFSQPEYRFESVDILLDELTAGQQEDLLSLELGDVVEVKFTPNQIPPAISKFAEVIRIDHNIDLDNHILSLGFATLESSFWRLDDLVFGRLDEGNSLAF